MMSCILNIIPSMMNTNSDGSARNINGVKKADYALTMCNSQPCMSPESTIDFASGKSNLSGIIQHIQ